MPPLSHARKADRGTMRERSAETGPRGHVRGHCIQVLANGTSVVCGRMWATGGSADAGATGTGMDPPE